MPTVEQSVEIARPPADVFELLTRVERWPEWQSTVKEAAAEGAVEQGTRISDTREFMGRRASSTLEVTEHDPPHRFSLRAVSGPLRYRIDHSLAETGDGSRLTVSAHADVPGLLGFAARPMLRRAERQMGSDLERLKELLER